MIYLRKTMEDSMKQYIAQRSFPNKLKSDILKLGAMAKADAATGNKVINATIGAF